MNEDDKNKDDEIGRINFLDMGLIQKVDGSVESEWFTKPTDTGIVMNWNSIAPVKYKRNLVVTGGPKGRTRPPARMAYH